MFEFELHPHTGDIRTELLVYEKGGVMKHVEAPARQFQKAKTLTQYVIFITRHFFVET